MTVNCFSGFFNRVEYNDKEMQNDNWFSKAEKAAQILRAPSHWLAAEVWYATTYMIYPNVNTSTFDKFERDDNVVGVMRKIIRVVVGIILSIPGQILALPLMAIAYRDEEIRLKRKVSVQSLSEEEANRLGELLEARQKLEEEKKGEPITCSILYSICYMLCCLVCKK
jgi:hypothetical protein